MRLQPVAVVFKKEVIDNLRDRRTLVGSLFYPLLGPLLVILLCTVMGRTYASKIDKPLVLPVVGAENGPGLVAIELYRRERILFGSRRRTQA